MGIVNKNNTTQNVVKDTPRVPGINQLSTQELEFLLNMLRTATLVGEQVEMFYNLVVKLQNQYIDQQDK
mgnify:CR=1 FL=1|jgi:hypothetical protein